MSSSPLGHHVNFRLVDGRVIAPAETERRRLARAVLLAAADSPLLAFCAPDTHLHLLAACGRAEAGELVRRVKLALTFSLRPPVPFTAAYFRPVESQVHLERAIDYVLGQHARHATCHDAARDASNLVDLLGMRLLGQSTLRCLRTLAPRVSPARLARHLGVARISDEIDLADLPGAAMSAACVTMLRGRTPDAFQARLAAVHTAGTRLGPSALAGLLGLSERAIRYLRDRPPLDHRLLRAVELQLRFRLALRQSDGHAGAQVPFVSGRPQSNSGGHDAAPAPGG